MLELLVGSSLNLGTQSGDYLLSDHLQSSRRHDSGKFVAREFSQKRIRRLEYSGSTIRGRPIQSRNL